MQAGLAAAAVAAAASSSWATKGHSLDPAAGVIDSGGSGGGGGGGREGAAAVVRAAADARSGAQQHHVHAGSSRPLGRAGGRAAAGVGVDCAEGTSDLQHRQQQQQQRAAASRGADGSDGGSGSSAAATGGVGGPVAAAAAPRSKLCWAVSYWRGFGAEPNICPPERPLFSHGRCYPGCPAGYGAREGPLCWMRHCPQSGWGGGACEVAGGAGGDGMGLGLRDVGDFEHTWKVGGNGRGCGEVIQQCGVVVVSGELARVIETHRRVARAFKGTVDLGTRRLHPHVPAPTPPPPTPHPRLARRRPQLLPARPQLRARQLLPGLRRRQLRRLLRAVPAGLRTGVAGRPLHLQVGAWDWAGAACGGAVGQWVGG